MSKTLVAYFSASGVTKKVAEVLAKETGADLFEIAPKVPYTSTDLDWTDKGSRTTKEKEDRSIHPEMVGDIDVSGYDTVYVGFPIWWYDAPNIVYGFLEAHDFSGKSMGAFATSGGSGMGNIDGNLKKACPGAKWGKGKRFTSANPKELSDWASSI
ncbi:MAG: flavodoxin [Thermoplasmata archaeon]|nr:flavodoxin [Thermoplasmata archaeon]